MIHGEAAFYPTGTIQTVTTDQNQFANALYEVALQAGYDIEIEVIGNGHTQLTLRGEEEDVNRLFQAAYALEDAWFWREMGNREIKAKVLQAA